MALIASGCVRPVSIFGGPIFVRIPFVVGQVRNQRDGTHVGQTGFDRLFSGA